MLLKLTLGLTDRFLVLSVKTPTATQIPPRARRSQHLPSTIDPEKWRARNHVGESFENPPSRLRIPTQESFWAEPVTRFFVAVDQTTWLLRRTGRHSIFWLRREQLSTQFSVSFSRHRWVVQFDDFNDCLDSGNRMKRELITNTVSKTNNLLANKHSILKSDGRSQNNAVTQLNLDKADRIVPRAQLPRGCLSRSSRPCFSMVDFIIIPKRRCLFRTSSERPSFLVNSAQADRNLDHVFIVVQWSTTCSISIVRSLQTLLESIDLYKFTEPVIIFVRTPAWNRLLSTIDIMCSERKCWRDSTMFSNIYINYQAAKPFSSQLFLSQTHDSFSFLEKFARESLRPDRSSDTQRAIQNQEKCLRERRGRNKIYRSAKQYIRYFLQMSRPPWWILGERNFSNQRSWEVPENSDFQFTEKW